MPFTIDAPARADTGTAEQDDPFRAAYRAGLRRTVVSILRAANTDAAHAASTADPQIAALHRAWAAEDRRIARAILAKAAAEGIAL